MYHLHPFHTRALEVQYPCNAGWNEPQAVEINIDQCYWNDKQRIPVQPN